jgi:hypothetical protein
MTEGEILKDMIHVMTNLEFIPRNEPDSIILIGEMPEPLESDLKKAIARNDGTATILQICF